MLALKTVSSAPSPLFIFRMRIQLILLKTLATLVGLSTITRCSNEPPRSGLRQPHASRARAGQSRPQNFAASREAVLSATGWSRTMTRRIIATCHAPVLARPPEYAVT